MPDIIYANIMTDYWKTYIDNNCRTVKGGINNRVAADKWWKSKDLEKLNQDSGWLPSDATIMERMFVVYHNLNSKPICIGCNTNNPNFQQFKSGYYECCSKLCAVTSSQRSDKIRKTTNDRFGTDRKAIVAKVSATNKIKHGTDFYYQTEEFKEKAKQTKIDRYGDENYHNPIQIKKTNLEKYGVEYTCQSPEVQKKIKETWNTLYGEGRTPSNIHLSNTVFDQLKDINTLVERNKNGESVDEIALSLDVWEGAIKYAFKNNNIEPINYYKATLVSNGQKQVQDFIESMGIETISNDRQLISPKELDIYIPSHNLAIEFNGIYWHSYDRKETPKEKQKHQTKLHICEAKGIRLLQICESEWLNGSKDIWKSIIKRAVKKIDITIGARECQIEFPDINTVREFLNTNHLQKFTPYKYAVGLTYKNQYIMIMTFCQSRYSDKYEWELNRLSTHNDHSVNGGAEKLLKAAQDQWKMNSIGAYSNSRVFSGKVYEKLGFVYSHETKPSYCYLDNKLNTYSRQQFQKHMLASKLPIYDSTYSEPQNMFNNGYRRLWDAGHRLWINK